MSLVLSLFPGIGLLDMAFEEEGFCVVRGPDLLWGGDIRKFHPPASVFDGVIGGPPCQLWSQMRHIQPLAGKRHGNMIPEFQRVVSEASPAWFVMENVRYAPLPDVGGYEVHEQLLRDVWVGGESMRLRRISFGTTAGVRLDVEQLALHTADPAPSALAGGGTTVPVAMQRGPNGKPVRKRRHGKAGKVGWLQRLDAQGLPHEFLDEAPFTVAGKNKAIGQGVPLPMGRAIAKAVKAATNGGAP